MTSPRRRSRFMICKAGLMAASSILAIGVATGSLHAQTFTGNQTTNGPFSSGFQVFSDTSALNASAANAVSGGDQTFNDSSMLNASAGNAVSGGQQNFGDFSTLNASAANAISGGRQYFDFASALNASAANAVSGGTQDFIHSTTLNATAANAVSGGEQDFHESSKLNASVADSVSGGVQIFGTNSTLNASTANAVSGGAQYFNDSSALNASAADAVSGGTQSFSATSTLNASVANAVSGGTQIFIDSSMLNASVADAVSGGTQTFNGSSALNASVANSVSGGTQTFNDSSMLNASVANAVSGGDQTFNGSSTLNASAANAVSGGVLSFYFGGTLNASATNAVSGGTQTFFFAGILNASAANAVSGGVQNFQGTSVLNASSANAVSGGNQTFGDSSALNASAANAVNGGTQTFYESTALNASVADAVSGGIQYFYDSSTLKASAADAVSGGAQTFSLTSALDASAADAVSGGTQTFYGGSALNATAANAVSGGTQTFYDKSVLNVLANNALTNAVAINLDYGIDAYGGVVRLNGYNTVVGGLHSLSSGAGVIANTGAQNSILTVDTSVLGNSAFSGLIEDDGVGTLGITKTGAGTLTLTGTDTYTGATTVSAGTLVVNGSIAASSLTTVQNGAILAGTGTVGATSVSTGGILVAGNGLPGTSMTLSSLTMQSGAFYQVTVDPASSSSANVVGNASLGGATVGALFASGSYVAKQYTILTAGGVTGSFNPTTVNGNLPSGFHTSLSYDPTHAYLNLQLNFVPPSGTGFSDNQQNVGDAIVHYFDTNGGIPIVFGGLTPAGLTQLSGEVGTGAQQATFYAMDQFLGVITDPFITGRGVPVGGNSSPKGGLAYADEGSGKTDTTAALSAEAAQPIEQRWRAWAAAYGGSQLTDGNSLLGSNDTRTSLYGLAVGADYSLSPDTVAGFAVAGGGTSFSVDGQGSGRSDLFQAGAFFRHNAGAAYLTGALAYGWQDFTTDRSVAVSGTDHLRGQFDANTWSGRLEGGYRLDVGGIGFTPYAAGQFTAFDMPSYAEQAISGADTFALAYNARSVTDTRSEIGLRLDRSFAMADGDVTLRGRLAWAHDFNPDRSLTANFQTLPGASFVVDGAAMARDSALVTAAVETKWRNGWSAAASFEGEFSSVTRSYSGKGVLRYAW